MASSQIFIPRDDAQGGLNLGGGTWTVAFDDFDYGGETIWPAFAEKANGPMGSMSITFQGTSIAFIGNTPANDPTKTSQIFTITIDDNKPYNTSTSDPDPQTYLQWYQSPTLPSGTHTITVGHMFGVALDYMVITPGQDTPLAGQTLMVDDYYEGITYTGSWQGSTGQKLDTGDPIGALPFQNSSHHTTTVGDSLSFSYTGTNMSVYGVYPWGNAGSLSVSYSIDGGSSFSNSFTSDGGNMRQQTHFKLVDTGPLSSGEHTIKLTLTGCINQFLMVDYILYVPSFSNLASMPNFTPTTTPGPSSGGSASGTSSNTTGLGIIGTSAAGGTTSGSSPTSIGSSTSHTTGGVGGTPGAPTLSPASANTDTGTPGPSKSNTSAIAGGVVGGIAALVIIAALALFFLRRWRLSQPDRPDTKQVLTGSTHTSRIQIAPNSPYAVEPFTGPPTAGLESSKPSPGTSGFQIQADNKWQIEGLQNLVHAHDSSLSSSSGADSENVEELRRRIQILQAQNDRLASLSAPPAYHTQ